MSAPNISPSSKSLEIGHVRKGLDGKMWKVAKGATGRRKWRHANASSNYAKRFVSGKTDKWDGEEVPQKILKDRNKMIKKLKEIDQKGSAKFKNLKSVWDSKLNFVVLRHGLIAPEYTSPANVVKSMKSAYNNGVNDYNRGYRSAKLA